MLILSIKNTLKKVFAKKKRNFNKVGRNEKENFSKFFSGNQ